MQAVLIGRGCYWLRNRRGVPETVTSRGQRRQAGLCLDQTRGRRPRGWSKHNPACLRGQRGQNPEANVNSLHLWDVNTRLKSTNVSIHTYVSWWNEDMRDAEANVNSLHLLDVNNRLKSTSMFPFFWLTNSHALRYPPVLHFFLKTSLTLSYIFFEDFPYIALLQLINIPIDCWC